jgi:GA-binding protein alpha chain
MVEDEFDDSIIIQHMEITEPLATLRKLLEVQLQCSLAEYEFWLQDSLQVYVDKLFVCTTAAICVMRYFL